MARYKPQDRNSMLLPVVLSEQIVPGSFAFALDYLVDNELDLTAMDAKFKNDDRPLTARSRRSPRPREWQVMVVTGRWGPRVADHHRT
jgi:hypothetical protein